MMKPNLPVMQTKPGAELNVFQENGCAMVIRIALTVPTKTLLCIIVPNHNLAAMINLLAETEGVSTRDGCVITIMIVAMVLTKAKIVTRNTKLVPLTNSRAKTLNAFVINIDVMERTIAVITLTKSIAVSYNLLLKFC